MAGGKFRKTHLGEDEVICDKCMQLARRSEVDEIRDPTSSLILHQHKKRCEDADK
jgi:hypothetical protein